MLLLTEMVEEVDAESVVAPKESVPPIKSVPPPKVMVAVSEITSAAEVEKVPVPVMLRALFNHAD